MKDECVLEMSTRDKQKYELMIRLMYSHRFKSLSISKIGVHVQEGSLLNGLGDLKESGCIELGTVILQAQSAVHINSRDGSDGGIACGTRTG